MNKITNFFKSAALMLLAMTASETLNAATHAEYKDGVEVGECTSVCLYNIGAHRFLTGGLDWGTHATADNAGRVIDLQESDDTFAMYSYSYSNPSFFPGYMTANGYIDTPNPDYWTFETASADGYTNVYRIKLADDQYLTYNPADLRVNVGVTTGTDADCWIIVPLSERMAQGDYTFLIQDSEFLRPWERKSWLGDVPGFLGGDTPDIGGFYYDGGNMAGKTTCIEHWNRKFNTYQEITNVPKGTYRLKVQGYYRVGNDVNDAAAAAAARETDSEVINAYFYANDVEVAFPSIFDNDCHENKGGDYVDAGLVYTINGQDCYIPTNMSQASKWFFDGAYETSLEVTVTGGTLTIGARNEADNGAQWAIFDNFRLEYLGFKGSLIEAAYNNLSAKLDGSAQTGFAEDWATISETIYSSEKEALAALNSCYAKYISFSPVPADVTALIINNSFETGDLTGWNINVDGDCGVKENSNEIYSTTGCDGGYLFNIWPFGHPLTQTIVGLPNGWYKMQVLIASDTNANLFLIANGSHSDVYNITGDKTQFVDAEYIFQVTDGKATIGVVGGNDDGSYNEDGYWWYKADNFRLTYLGADIVTLAESGLCTYSCTYEVAVPEGLEAYYASSCDASSVHMTKIADGIIPANTGVVLKGTASEEYTLMSSSSDAETIAGNLLVAVASELSLASTTGDKTNYVLKGGKFHPFNGSATVGAGKAYLQASSSEVKNIVFDDEPTGIESLTSALSEGEEVIYNLNGVRVDENYKGIVIMNGKKVMKK